MGLYNVEKFNESPSAQFDGLFDWDFLDDAFPRKIKPMDIDGIIEINERLLIIETKRRHNKVPDAQSQTLRALHSYGGMTIFIIKMDGDKDVNRICNFQVMFPNDKEMTVVDLSKGNPKQIVFDYVKKWANDADNFGNLTKK